MTHPVIEAIYSLEQEREDLRDRRDEVSYFGFTPEGSDVAPLYRDQDFSCGAGTNETTGKCWDGLSTTPKIIAVSSAPNHPSGSTTTARFRAETGEGHIQTAGEYQVVIEVTAISL